MEFALLKLNIDCKATTIHLRCYYCYCRRTGLPSLHVVWNLTHVYFFMYILSFFLLDKSSTVGGSFLTTSNVYRWNSSHTPSSLSFSSPASSSVANCQGMKTWGRHTSVTNSNHLGRFNKVLAMAFFHIKYLWFLFGQSYTESKVTELLYPYLSRWERCHKLTCK